MSSVTDRAAGSGADAPSGADRRALWFGALLVTCAATFVATEACLVLPGHLLEAQIVDALLVLVLVNIGPRHRHHLSAHAAAIHPALRALALAPLIRVLSLGVPTRGWSEAAGVLLIAVAIGFAGLRMAPAVGVGLRGLLSPRPAAPHGPAIAAGLLLGIAAYFAGAPVLWAQGAESSQVALAIGAALCAAVTEELVFRGILQVTFQRALGAAGVLLACAIFAATYLDAGATALVLIYALAGFIFARSVSRSARLGGAIIGHVLLALGAGAAWPVILGRVPPFELPQPLTTILLTIAITLAASAASGTSS